MVVFFARPPLTRSQEETAEPFLSGTLELLPFLDTETPTATSTEGFEFASPEDDTTPLPTPTILLTRTVMVEETLMPVLLTPEATLELSLPLSTDIPEVALPSTAEATLETAIVLTAELTQEPEQTPELIITFSETPSTAAPLIMLTGRARYQSRIGDNGGIQALVIDDQGAPLALTVTDASGQYTISVLSKAAYQITFRAPLHREVTIGFLPGTPLAEIVLEGGDLNADGCIGAQDVRLLTLEFGQTQTVSDITGDGLTDASDLAILAGNYDDIACRSVTASILTPTPTLETIPTLIATTDLPPSPVVTVEAIQTWEVTAESPLAVGG